MSYGLSIIVVVSEDREGQPASREYCASVREAFGLTMTVVRDPDLSVEAMYGGADLFLVTDPAARILYRRTYAPLEEVEAALGYAFGL